MHSKSNFFIFVSGNNYNENREQIDTKSEQWFGATVASAGIDGPLVVSDLKIECFQPSEIRKNCLLIIDSIYTYLLPCFSWFFAFKTVSMYPNRSIQSLHYSNVNLNVILSIANYLSIKEHLLHHYQHHISSQIWQIIKILLQQTRYPRRNIWETLKLMMILNKFEIDSIIQLITINLTSN